MSAARESLSFLSDGLFITAWQLVPYVSLSSEDESSDSEVESDADTVILVDGNNNGSCRNNNDNE